MGSDEFLKRMVKALGTIIDRCPKGRLYKKGKLNHGKNRIYLYFYSTRKGNYMKRKIKLSEEGLDLVLKSLKKMILIYIFF